MTYTVVLASTRTWLTDPSDDSVAVTCGSTRPQDWTDVVDGTVRQYAGGRRQGVLGVSTLKTVPVVLTGLSVADVATLKTLRGRVVLFRSKFGERMYCVFYSMSGRNLDHVSLNDGRAVNVTVELYEVDYDEGLS